MRTGIMGGTFDPIHHGHLFLAQEVMVEYQLDRIIFVPSKIGPHKLARHSTAPHHRLKMVQMATRNHPGFEVSDIEICRSGLSYTIDTIEAFQKEYPEDVFYFITGADAILTIETWRDFKTLLKRVTFIAATRASLDDEHLKKEVARLNKTYQARIIIMDMLDLEISSSVIRSRVALGKPITYLVPEIIEKRIIEEGLYAD